MYIYNIYNNVTCVQLVPTLPQGSEANSLRQTDRHINGLKHEDRQTY